MHIYSSLGLTQSLAAQTGSPIKKAQNQKAVEANNKLNAKPNNKANTSTDSFKDKLTLSKQTLGFKEIANKYDLTNVSFKEAFTAAHKLYESGLITFEERSTIQIYAGLSLFKGFKIPEHNGGEFEIITRDESEKFNFSGFMNERLEFKLSEDKPSYDEIKRLKDAIVVLDKLTALRSQSYA